MQGDFFGKLTDQIAMQKDSFFLWSPVFLGLGIGIYFYLPFEPSFWLGLCLFLMVAALMALTFRLRDNAFRPVYVLSIMFALSICGFLCGQLRTYAVHSPVLERKIAFAVIEGVIESVEPLEEGDGARIVLRTIAIEKLMPEEMPKRVRLRLRSGDNILVGQHIKIMGELNPPSGPVVPGGFDFRRFLYFSGIGAVGFGYKVPEIIEQPKSLWARDIEGLRQTIGMRIENVLEPKESAVTLALMIGQQRALSAEDMQAIRDSGLAHMLSISGLHITLLAGVLFFLSRLLMAVIPDFAVRYPIKKFAAVFAMAGAVFYMLAAGSTAPTVRSVLMIGVVFLAVILDRSAISLRLVAFAALVILVFQPENLVSVSFQMSFAAVAALIAFFDGTRNFWSKWSQDPSLLQKALAYVSGVCMTTLIATTVTTPFSIYHFQQFAFMRVVANFIAVPLLSFFIMPAIILAFFLMPLELEFIPLYFVGIGVEMILKIAHTSADFPHAVLHFSVIPFASFVLCVFAGLWIILWKGWGKIAGCLFLIPALIFIMTQKMPDMLISENHKLVGLYAPDGKLYVSTLRAEKFSRENWEKYSGLQKDEALAFPKEGMIGDFATCTPQGCRFTIAGQNVAWLSDPYEVRRDCAWADVLVSSDSVDKKKCKAPVIVDKFDTWREGAYAVWLEPENNRSVSAAQYSGLRPWTREDRSHKRRTD